MQEKKLLTGLFRQHDNAGKAYNAALKYGYQKDEINILMSAETKQKNSYQRQLCCRLHIMRKYGRKERDFSGNKRKPQYRGDDRYS